jgi:hypothetical protein
MRFRASGLERNSLVGSYGGQPLEEPAASLSVASRNSCRSSLPFVYDLHAIYGQNGLLATHVTSERGVDEA